MLLIVWCFTSVRENKRLNMYMMYVRIVCWNVKFNRVHNDQPATPIWVMCSVVERNTLSEHYTRQISLQQEWRHYHYTIKCVIKRKKGKAEKHHWEQKIKKKRKLRVYRKLSAFSSQTSSTMFALEWNPFLYFFQPQKRRTVEQTKSALIFISICST